jgi:hypothetical protein
MSTTDPKDGNVAGPESAGPGPSATAAPAATATPAGHDLALIRQMVDQRVREATAAASRRVRVLSWVAVVFALVALGTSAALAYYTYYYGLPGITSPSIRAHELILVDRAGNERGFWRVDREGTTRLSMADPQGVDRLRLTVRADGEQAVALADGSGAARIALAVLDDGAANLAFADARGQTRTVLGLSATGSASLLFTDQLGGARAAMGIGADGSPTFWWPDMGNGRNGNGN